MSSGDVQDALHNPESDADLHQRLARIETKMDVHQYVRGELEIAKQQLSTQAESHQRYVTKRILTATLAILGVLGLGNLAAWWGGANYLKTRTQEAIDQSASAVRQRINQEFATPRIHAIVTEVATNEAQELLQRKVQPEQ